MLTPPLSRLTTVTLSLLAPITALLYLASAPAMKVQCISCAAVLLASPSAHVVASSTPSALDPTTTNLILNPAGQVIYYNATGDTPSYHETSPDPIPITPINR